ncbi:MAG: phenylalanine--tRNA ligase subunit alpha [Candidatus Micrarchaeota archaeon]
MHKYVASVLSVLQKEKSSSLNKLIEETGLTKDAVLWALEELQSKGLVVLKKRKSISIIFSDEGLRYAQTMLPEEALLKRLAKEEVKISELNNEERIGFQWLKAKGLVEIKEGFIVLKEGQKEIEEGSLLRALYQKPDEADKLISEHKRAFENLLKRKLVSIKEREEIDNIEITELGKKEKISIEEDIGELNREIIANKSWQGKKFRKYDINISVEDALMAKRHPLKNFIDEIKDAYLSMGFKEISGPIIEPSFWVFDSLFVPQDHPAREMQDTFYLINPGKVNVKDEKLIKKVKAMHEKAWHINWYKEVAEQALLRTHTTSVSARFIYKLRENLKELASISSVKPLQLFSVGRVFRNESIDYKHLAEFYQTDGIVVGINLTLANLFDVLKRIYASIGVEIKFKPSYFPFVEPGVEVDILYNDEWLELGGAGIIRKEITDIVSKKITVLAWGLGVERALMAKDKGINSITELFNSNLGWLRRKVIV